MLSLTLGSELVAGGERTAGIGWAEYPVGPLMTGAAITGAATNGAAGGSLFTGAG